MREPTADEISHPIGAGVNVQLKDIQKTLPLRVLSQKDWDHWTTKGFVIVKNAVPRENIDRLVQLLWEFDDKDPNDQATWYAAERAAHVRAELNNAGMVEIYNHQYLWDNRQVQRIYDAFVDIWDREDLWVAIDRANLNVPKQDKSGSQDGFFHWDVNTSLEPKPIGVQGVLSLLPQDEATGGFQCAPYLFEHFDEWVQKPTRGPQSAFAGYGWGRAREYLDGAGGSDDFQLAFGTWGASNFSDGRVRMAQYISMYPSDPENAAERAERVRLWREMEPPNRPDFPGDPRGWKRPTTAGLRI